MSKLINNQNILFDNSEISLINVFTPLEKTSLPFTNKLKSLKSNYLSPKLIKSLSRIEKEISTESAIKFFNGYIEYNNISLSKITNQINNLDTKIVGIN